MTGERWKAGKQKQDVVSFQYQHEIDGKNIARAQKAQRIEEGDVIIRSIFGGEAVAA